MDVLITWICLGGGLVAIILSMVVISVVQSRTRGGEAPRRKSERGDGPGVG